ncbi:MAG: hypothetical protein OSB44_02830 [Verrucomicrobiales bacterium]|nr:hypothetical protein [Verrucomicrobiales bacterium]
MKKIIYSLLITISVSSLALSQNPQEESDHYPIVEIPIPDNIVLEVGGIEVLPGKRIAVSSRRGDIYVVEGAYTDDPGDDKWIPWAIGLHEVLGLAWKDGWLYATQRPEVTRMKDEDGDFRADIFESVSSAWGVNGDYHEYAFGSRHDPDGNIWVVLCLTGSGGASSDFRGWCVRVTPDGKMLPTTSGIRSPGGIGQNHLGDMFYCDNQGVWNGTSSIKPLPVGGFVGNPTGNKYYELTDAIGKRPKDPKSGSRLSTERAKIPELVPPAAMFPHGKLSNSPTGIACDTSGKFGPFTNQLFVGEQTLSTVLRVALEKVNGVYQGAAFPFRGKFKSGNVAVRLGPDGSMFVGGTDRGWGARGGKRFALERCHFNGKKPFEVLQMKAKPDGFEVIFTEPIEEKSGSDIASYKMDSYTYIYQSGYGSPVVDKSNPTIKSASVSQDKKSVYLKIEGLVKGNVHELNLPGIKNVGGKALLHQVGYYTLNEIPEN